MKEKAELVFIPSPSVGHLVSLIVFAKRLLLLDPDNAAGSNNSFSITVLVMQEHTSDNDAHIKSLAGAGATADASIRFIGVPKMDPPPLDYFKSPEKFITEYVDSHKDCIKEAII